MSRISGGEAMSERTSYRYENKEYLLKTIMNQLGMTEEDLEQDPSWVKAKVRDMAKSRQAKEENMELISALKEDISQLLKQVQELTDENSSISRKNSDLEENLRRAQMMIKAVQPKDLSYYLSNRIV